jgi:hypothetical protein
VFIDTSMITHTLKLDTCWCCTSKFSLHDHHVVPREHGGNNGPTVTICASCHNIVHRIASRIVTLKSDAPITELRPLQTSGYDVKKLGYLIGVIVRSQQTLKKLGPQPKKLGLVVKLDDEQRRKFLQLKKTLGKTNHALVVQALDELYRKTFL